MSKELLKPEQFSRVNTAIANQEQFQLNTEQQAELNDLYESTVDKLNPGQLIMGTIVKVDNGGVLVDIKYKSDGLIPRYEFSDHELKEFKTGDEIEIMLDELESIEGDVVLSYEKAKSMRAWDKITKLFDDGKPVEGVVTHKVKGGLSVDIGVPAFLPGSQVDLQRVTDFDIFVGQPITAEIIKINQKRGNVIISRRKYLSERRADERKRILETLTEDSVIQGVVKNITNYGVFIDIGGVDGLLHITDMTWGRISHPSELVKIGETITIKVLSIDKDNDKISLGLKQLSGNPWQELDPSIKVGSIVNGTVSSITEYGLFVEVTKGVEGLVHISEVSWVNRIADLGQHYKVGDKIEALVVSLDKENRRMSLSIKQLAKSPWESISSKFKVGDKIKGTISNITDFGIFIQLIPGVDGLAHVSDLSWTEHIDHPTDRYKRGSEVEAVILGIDTESKKISLGIKQLDKDPWDTIEQTYPVGSIVEGKVSKIANFGAFVKLPNGVEGLIHISDITQDKDKDKIEELLSVGQDIKLRVVGINKQDRKLSLSLKLEGEIPQQAEPVRRKAKESAPKTQQSAPQVKAKSLLQVELEKLANKKNK